MPQVVVDVEIAVKGQSVADEVEALLTTGVEPLSRHAFQQGERAAGKEVNKIEQGDSRRHVSGVRFLDYNTVSPLPHHLPHRCLSRP